MTECFKNPSLVFINSRTENWLKSELQKATNYIRLTNSIQVKDIKYQNESNESELEKEKLRLIEHMKSAKSDYEAEICHLISNFMSTKKKPRLIKSVQIFIDELNDENQLNKFLKDNKFDYSIKKGNIFFPILQLFDTNEKSVNLFDLTFENFLKFNLLIWKYSKNVNNYHDDKNDCIVLDMIDCHLSSLELNSLVDLIKNEIKIKTYILTYHNGEYIVGKSNNLIPFKNKDKIKCNHGYINEFVSFSTKNEQLFKNFKQLENFSDWKNIPMYAVLVGKNSIGKTSILKYFKETYKNSLYVSGFSSNNIAHCANFLNNFYQFKEYVNLFFKYYLKLNLDKFILKIGFSIKKI